MATATATKNQTEATTERIRDLNERILDAGKKAGSALYVTNRVARAGLLRVTLRSRGLLAKLRAGTYVMEVRSGQSLGSLGATRRIAFTVTP